MTLKLPKFLVFFLITLPLFCEAQEVHVLDRYYLAKESDQSLLHYYLEEAFIPFLQRNGASGIIAMGRVEGEDEVEEVAVLYTLSSLSKFQRLSRAKVSDKLYRRLAEPFLDPPHNALPFARMERILFETGPLPYIPRSGNDNETVFEFLFYGSPSTAQMQEYLDELKKGNLRKAFDAAGIDLLMAGIQLSGEDLPGMGFLLQFENSEARAEQWKTFLASEAWQILERDPDFQDNLDRSNSVLYKKL